MKVRVEIDNTHTEERGEAKLYFIDGDNFCASAHIELETQTAWGHCRGDSDTIDIGAFGIASTLTVTLTSDDGIRLRRHATLTTHATLRELNAGGEVALEAVSAVETIEWALRELVDATGRLEQYDHADLEDVYAAVERAIASAVRKDW